MTFPGLKIAFTALLSLSLIACQTITVRPDGAAGKLSTPPDYQASHHFFLGGLIGEAVIPVGKICPGKKAVQLQSQTTFLNGIVPFLISLVGFAVAITVAAELFAKATANEDISDAFLAAGLIALPVLLSTAYTPKTAKVWCGEEKTAKSAVGAGLLEAI